MLLAVSENMIPAQATARNSVFCANTATTASNSSLTRRGKIRPRSSKPCRNGHCCTQHARSDARPAFRGPKRTQAQIEMLKGVCGLAEELDVSAVVIVPVFGGPRLPNLTPWRSVIELEEAMLDTILPEIGRIAANHGVTLVMEPLNRYETHFLNTLGARRGNLPACGPPADSGHGRLLSHAH